jgi:hypothetical protein
VRAHDDDVHHQRQAAQEALQAVRVGGLRAPRCVCVCVCFCGVCVW